MARAPAQRRAFVSMQFPDIWAAFMRFPGVRAWLFNRNPLAPTEAFACVTNHPEPWSFRFGQNQPVDQKQPDNFGELGTLLFHDSGTALGVTFNASKKQPLLPVAYKFTNDPEFLNETVVVRRCAIRKASPTSTDLLRLQCDWFESGVLGVDYAIIPESAPDLRPSVGYAVFGYRVYRSADADRIHLAAHSPDQYFLAGTTSLLAPPTGFVTLDGCDSQFQTPCMYCAYRNAVLCHCPAPLRRRVTGDNYNPGATARIVRSAAGPSSSSFSSSSSSDSNDTVVWDYYSHRMKSSLTAGTFLTNWRYLRPSAYGGGNDVVCAVAHIVPYSVMFTKTGGEFPIIQRVLTTLGMSTKSPTVVASLDLAAICFEDSNAVMHTEAADAFLDLDDSDAVMSLDTISNIDPDCNSLLDPSTSQFTEIPVSDHPNSGKPGSIFFDDALLGISVNNPASDKAISPTSVEYADTELNLTHAPTFTAKDIAHIDMAASRKRNRVSPREIEKSLVKRMQYSILPSEIATVRDFPSPELLIQPPRDISPAESNEQNCRNKLSKNPVADAVEPPQAADAVKTPHIAAAPKSSIPIPLRPAVENSSTAGPSKAPTPGGAASGGAGTGATNRPGGGRARIQKKETRKWQCEQCDAVIRGKRSNLTRHVANKHSNVRAFECTLPDCGRRFQTRLNLVRHQTLVHEGRPFECSSCPRAFKTEETLDRHRTTVHAPGSSTLACPFCAGCYGKRSTLSRHIASVHKNLAQGAVAPATARAEVPGGTANA